MDPFTTSGSGRAHSANIGLKRLSATARRNLTIAVIVCLAIAFIAFTAFGEPQAFEFLTASASPGTTNPATASDKTAPADGANIVPDDTRNGSEDADKPLDTTPAVYVVYVTGAVVSPGIYTLPEHSRIGDAVAAAGGFIDDAATAAVNLAEQLLDGMHIHIPTNEDVSSGRGGSSGLYVSGGTGNGSSASSSTVDKSQQVKVNINTADSATLQTLAGIGPVTAQKIIDYRNAHGPFRSKEDIKNVSGIGEKRYEAIADYITL